MPSGAPGDKAKDEYIDILHDRIQFLLEELQDSEETVLEMKQEMNESDVVYDPLGVIPISDYLDWLEREGKVDERRIDRLRERLRNHPLAHEKPGARSPRTGLTREEAERVGERVDEIKDSVDWERRTFDLGDELEDEMKEMRDRTRAFREKHGLNKDEEDDDVTDSESGDEEGEKSLADKVSEYEFSGDTGSSPGDHI